MGVKHHQHHERPEQPHQQQQQQQREPKLWQNQCDYHSVNRLKPDKLGAVYLVGVVVSLQVQLDLRVSPDVEKNVKTYRLWLSQVRTAVCMCECHQYVFAFFSRSITLDVVPTLACLVLLSAGVTCYLASTIR